MSTVAHVSDFFTFTIEILKIVLKKYCNKTEELNRSKIINKVSIVCDSRPESKNSLFRRKYFPKEDLQYTIYIIRTFAIYIS